MPLQDLLAGRPLGWAPDKTTHCFRPKRAHRAGALPGPAQLRVDDGQTGSDSRIDPRLLPGSRPLAQKRFIYYTSINGESWLVVYGLPVAQRLLR